jgi:hypothetical protein
MSKRLQRSSATSTVFLLDPHGDTAELYEWALEDAGFRVRRAGSPRTSDSPPDLAIAVMREPDCSMIRRMLGDTRVPTLVLTSWVVAGATAADFDCDALMMLPVSPDALVLKAAELLRAASV